MIDAFQKLEEIKFQGKQNMDEILKVLREKIKNSKLPDFYLAHMSGIISEEPPNSGQEMFELVGEFVKNGNKVSDQDAIKLCAEIYQELTQKKIIEKESKKWAAERMQKSITLNEVELVKQLDIDLDEENKTKLNDNDDIEKEETKQNKKKKEKEASKIREHFERFKQDMEKNAKKLPPIQVRHFRNADGKSLDLVLENINVIIGGRELLQDSRVKLAQGRKYGLIGRNGIGKTCFMNALARGDFDKIPKHLQILLVEQEITGEEKSALDLVVETDQERLTLLQQEQEIYGSNDAKSKEKLNEIFIRLEQIEAHLCEHKAQQILSGLGFSNEMMRRPTKDLSGGWRMRVSLARALFVQPDILLLDEPTNHLDLDAVMWLEDYIINCHQTVVIVSHAREFLNVCCDEIIHYHDQKLTYYKGNYDSFEKVRSEKLKLQSKQHESQQDAMAHMQSFIDKFRYNAKRASMVQSRIKAMNKMELIDEIVDDPSCVFIFPTPEKLRPPLLKLEDGNFGYNKDDLILKNINFNVDCESRVSIVGANGVGKSTLLKLLVGKLQLIEGNQYRNQRLRVSMFTQHHLDTLDLTLSPVEQFTRDFPKGSQEQIRGHLSSFGISGNLALRPNYLLSGGQKSRVAFALAVWNNPHILILDEPTNHLDIDAVNALIIALNNYQGGIVIVSHDQHLISTVVDEIWYVKDHRLKKFQGDFDDYRVALQSNKLP